MEKGHARACGLMSAVTGGKAFSPRSKLLAKVHTGEGLTGPHRLMQVGHKLHV